MGEKATRLREFLAELKRRRVFRVVVVYAVVTFGVLQVADIAFPALKLPDWTITLTVALALLGFPVALVLAWAFDITPRGVVRTEPLPEEVTRRRRPSPLLAGISVLVVSALTVAAGWYLLPKLPGWWSEERPATAGAERKTLVVLPFVNLGEPFDAYFADGITEEITARLAGIRGLGVIARTTAVRYKDTDKTIEDIGRELGVDYVLEGTVRWENVPNGPNRVRVTPQLIKSQDATHVWAQIYEQPLASVFQVQSEIAERVVEALDLTLRESELLALKAEPTNNLEAWNYYLLGREYLASSASQASAQQALEMLEKAVELDPDFQLAREKLAEAHANIYWGVFRLAIGVRRESWEEAVSRLNRDSFGADSAFYYLGGGVLLRRAGRTGPARAYFDSARAILEPVVASNQEAFAHAQYGLALAGLGSKERALGEARKAAELLPLSDHPYAGAALVDNLAHVYVMTDAHDSAIEQLQALVATEAPISKAWLRVDPTWDPLRDDPEFQKLLEDGSE